MFSRTPQNLKLAMSLMRLTRFYNARLNQTASKYQLTSDQVLVLHLLAQANAPLTVSKLSDRSTVNQPAVSKMMKRFESLGYIAKIHVSNDRRKTLIKITDAGHGLLGEIQNRVARNIIPLLASLDEETRASLERASNELSQKLSA